MPGSTSSPPANERRVVSSSSRRIDSVTSWATAHARRDRRGLSRAEDDAVFREDEAELRRQALRGALEDVPAAHHDLGVARHRHEVVGGFGVALALQDEFAFHDREGLAEIANVLAGHAVEVGMRERGRRARDAEFFLEVGVASVDLGEVHLLRDLAEDPALRDIHVERGEVQQRARADLHVRRTATAVVRSCVGDDEEDLPVDARAERSSPVDAARALDVAVKPSRGLVPRFADLHGRRLLILEVPVDRRHSGGHDGSDPGDVAVHQLTLQARASSSVREFSQTCWMNVSFHWESWIMAVRSRMRTRAVAMASRAASWSPRASSASAYVRRM